MATITLGHHEALEERAKRARLHRAGILHKILEILDYATSPNLTQKAATRRKRLVRQRAVTREIGGFYQELKERDLSETTLLYQARALYRRGLDKGQVEQTLTAQSLRYYEDVAVEPRVERIQRISESAARDYVDDLDLEEDEPEPDTSRAILMVGGLVAAHLLAAKKTLANRIARLVAKLTSPLVPPRPTNIVIAQLKAELVWTRRARALATARTEASEAESVPAHEILEQTQEERRLVTMEDDRVCDICIRDSATGWIPVAQPYPSGGMMPPIHINCRCYEEGRTGRGKPQITVPPITEPRTPPAPGRPGPRIPI